MPGLRKLGRYGMTETIEKSLKYGSYIDDMTLNNSSVELSKGLLLRLYKSRSGQAAKNKPRRLFVGKDRYYIDKDLNSEQLQKVRKYIKDLRAYRNGKLKEKPKEPRFNGVKPRHRKKQSEFKDKKDWDKLAARYETIAVNSFNCSGAKVFGDYYITLTQRDRRLKGEKVANAQYQAFLKAFKRWIGSKRTKTGNKFKYSLLTVKEYGSQGFHFHILLRVLLPLKQVKAFIEKVWKKNGYVSIEHLTDALKLSKYFFGSSNDRVMLQGDQALLDQQIQEKKAMIDDFIYLSKRAKDKGKKDLAKSYKQSIKEIKGDLKALRRAKVKRSDKIMSTSGSIKRKLRITSQDKYLWQFIRKNARYVYSELIQVKDVDDTGKTYIMNEIYSDYYELEKDKATYLYNYVERLLKQGKARRK